MNSIKFGVTGTARKDLVKAICEFTDTTATYQGVPSMAYRIGDYEVARDGMLIGPNLQATADLVKVCKNVPIIHSGGVKSLADITALKPLPIAGIIIGKSIYEGTLNVEDAVKELAT